MPPNETELPDIGRTVGPLLAELPREHQPLFVALAERMAAQRYRAWAEMSELTSYRKRLLACADREEDIASRVESLDGNAASIQRKVMQRFPNLEDLGRGMFAGRPLRQQLTIQARGERLGAATWRSFAKEAGEDAALETFLACAGLEEASAAVLEEIVAAGKGDALEVRHLSMDELEAGLDEIRRSPRDGGVLRMIVRRPRTEEREVVEQGELDREVGLVGDNWKARGFYKTPDGLAHPDMQLNIMNVRVTTLVAVDRSRWSLAGDQLYVDFDLSGENLPPGTRLAIGSAVIEVTAEPHLGCSKFVSRFGRDAMKFVNSEVGRELKLRGINAKVIRPGSIRVGDRLNKA